MEGIKFYSVFDEPFELFGLYGDIKNDGLRRVPETVAQNTSSEVHRLSTNTSGGRIRFKTDSDTVVIRINSPYIYMPHTTGMMTNGADLYIDKPNGSFFVGAVRPQFNQSVHEATISMPEGENEVTVYLPLYGNVERLEIGLSEGSSLSAHTPYRNSLPIVFYGSSITQGACASRPGLSYAARISRKYNLDFTCLGFSGACRAEDAMVDHIASLPMIAFVSDYDHNAPNPEYLRQTHFPLYEKIRAAHPSIPYFFVTRPDFYFNEDCMERRAIIMESYLRAWRAGDRNVYFIDGSAFFNGRVDGDLTLDLTHPSDEGFALMANYIGDVIAKAMSL